MTFTSPCLQGYWTLRDSHSRVLWICLAVSTMAGRIQERCRECYFWEGNSAASRCRFWISSKPSRWVAASRKSTSWVSRRDCQIAWIKWQVSLKDVGLEVEMCSMSSRVGSTGQGRVSTRSEGALSNPLKAFSDSSLAHTKLLFLKLCNGPPWSFLEISCLHRVLSNRQPVCRSQAYSSQQYQCKQKCLLTGAKSFLVTGNNVTLVRCVREPTRGQLW